MVRAKVTVDPENATNYFDQMHGYSLPEMYCCLIDPNFKEYNTLPKLVRGSEHTFFKIKRYKDSVAYKNNCMKPYSNENENSMLGIPTEIYRTGVH